MAKFKIEKLDEEVRKVKFVLEKQGMHVVESQVGLILDVSGSMQNLYDDGVVQSTIERLLPVGLACDVDAQLDVWGFSGGSNGFAAMTPVTAKNYVDYIGHEMKSGLLDKIYGGGTSYAPVIDAALRHFGLVERIEDGWFRRAREVLREEGSDDLPIIIYFVTDGENDDAAHALNLFETMEEAGSQIYFQLIGVGNANFRFLKTAAERFHNVGFLNVRDLTHFVENDSAYQLLLPAELCEWLNHEHDEDDDHV